MTTQTQHTSGPWVSVRNWVHSPKTGGICTVDTCEESESIARLISAAPDMFQALQAVSDYFGDKDGILLDQIRAALAKAKGEKTYTLEAIG